MREIKFRAWDKEDRNWYFYGEEVWSLGPEIRDMKDMQWDKNNFILMQFTSILDKNKKEIYEGDIVRVEFGKSGKTRDIVVEWKDGGFSPRTLSKGHWEVIGNIYEHTI